MRLASVRFLAFLDVWFFAGNFVYICKVLCKNSAPNAKRRNVVAQCRIDSAYYNREIFIFLLLRFLHLKITSELTQLKISKSAELNQKNVEKKPLNLFWTFELPKFETSEFYQTERKKLLRKNSWNWITYFWTKRKKNLQKQNFSADS